MFVNDCTSLPHVRKQKLGGFQTLEIGSRRLIDVLQTMLEFHKLGRKHVGGSEPRYELRITYPSFLLIRHIHKEYIDIDIKNEDRPWT